MKLSIIIPSYSETNSIVEVIRRIQAVPFQMETEIVLVDDASRDRTFEKEAILRIKNRKKKNNIRLFKNRINKGKGFSIRKGIRHSRGDIIVIQDADYEYDPQEIPKLLEPILTGKAEVVYGSRFLSNLRPLGMALPNWFANRLLTQLTNCLYGLNLTDMETCYKVFKADVLKGMKLKADRFTFEPEVTALLAKKKIKIVELPISYNGRTAKQGKKIKTRDFFFAILTLIRHLF